MDGAYCAMEKEKKKNFLMKKLYVADPAVPTSKNRTKPPHSRVNVEVASKSPPASTVQVQNGSDPQDPLYCDNYPCQVHEHFPV
jgi:hypothetical protein